jgi:tetratricopeptide (TPR) repeat protein
LLHLVFISFLLFSVASSHALGLPQPSPDAPVLSGMGTYRLPRVSPSPQAQHFFRQGMTLAWGFNPEEAARAFATAAKLDPRCALCWWGLAWAQGPNINVDMAPDAGTRIGEALTHARAASHKAPARTRALVEALAKRHPHGRLDEEHYARAMQRLVARFPTDADIATLAAEARLDLHPYDWWDTRGEPKPWTPEIEQLLVRALRLQPDHPGANHYWIHLQESSSHPERALESARRLTSMVPGSGHLLHMPAHIYMRVGRYADASSASERSIAADERYQAEAAASKAYRVGYVAHNHHFLWAAAAMEGRSEVALRVARDAYPAACGPGRSDRSTGLLQQYYVMPLYALVRFGRWQELLTDTLPADVAEPYPLALWHYARGTAYAKTGNIDAGRGELAKLKEIADLPALTSVKIKNLNPASALVRIAMLTLNADLALADGHADAAVLLLQEATAIEDGFAYDEPHLWLAPTRHALGAALLVAHRPAEAERAFREDLLHYPDNGWSLFGLAQALREQKKADEATDVERRYTIAWRAADVRLPAARF